MSLRKIIDWSYLYAEGDLIGKVASSFYQYYVDSENWVWACDVDIGEEEVLRNVPIASNNLEISYAEIGKAVALRKIGKGKYTIVGLAKTSLGFEHITYVSFEEVIEPGKPPFIRPVIQSSVYVGYTIRRLKLGELATCGGFGNIPLCPLAKFDNEGNFISLV